MKVFISSELEANHPLVAASISLGFHLIQQSLLTFSAVEGLPTKPYDIVFFSSPRAYTFGKQFILPETKVACVSIGTAKHSTHPIDWCGNSPGKPNKLPWISNNGLANGGYYFLFRLAAWEAFHRYSLQHKSNALRFIKRY
jgi:hypothetical protein